MVGKLFAASILLSSSVPATAQWQAVEQGEICGQALPPTPQSPAFFALSSDGKAVNGKPMVMVTIASPHLAALNEGVYYGELLMDKGHAQTPALVQRTADGGTMVGMMMPLEHLDVLVNSSTIHAKIDGRTLIRLSPQGRVGAAQGLRNCLAKSPEQRRTTPSVARANPAAGAATKAQDPLAAAIAAGDRVARGEPSSPMAAAPVADPTAGVNDWMTMFRVNNRLINNGGNFADPAMGNVIWGLDY